MSVLSFTEAYRDDASIEFERAVVNRYFEAVCSAASDGVFTLLAERADLVPGQPHPSDFRLRVARFNPVRVEGTNKFDITVEYSTLTPPERIDNPLDRPAEIEWSFNTYSVAALKDKDDKPMTNSAGSMPDPPPQDDDHHWVASITKNVSALPSWILTYANAVNSGPFAIDGLVAETRSAKLTGLRRPSLKWENDVPFYPLGLQIEFRDGGWPVTFLDEGLYDSNGDPILDNEGEPVTEPWPLDGAGAKLSSRDPNNYVFRTYHRRPEKDFSVIPVV